jgi:ribonucleoside-diphosphate reductase alpha chain
MHDMYMTAWKLGLKCTYYLRTLGASQIEKSTLDAKKYGYTQKRQYDSKEEATAVQEPAIEMAPESTEPIAGKACSISADPDCEVCQ